MQNMMNLMQKYGLMPQGYASGGSVEDDQYTAQQLDNELGGMQMLSGQQDPNDALAYAVGTTAMPQALVQKYTENSGYAEQLAEARRQKATERQAFTDAYTRMLQQPAEDPNGKAELYFRLAAAMSQPTRTGQFTESLGNANKELAEYAKGRSAAAKERDVNSLALQKMRLDSAESDVDDLTPLVRNEQTVAARMALLEGNAKANASKPLSDLGRQAHDMGLEAGTPEYKAFMQDNLDMKKNEQQAALNQKNASVEAQLKKQKELPNAIIKLKDETEKQATLLKTALTQLQTAHSVIGKTLDPSIKGTIQRPFLERLSPDNPELNNSKTYERAMETLAAMDLKTIFSGSQSNAEGEWLRRIKGVSEKNPTQQKAIVEEGMNLMRDRALALVKKHKEITSGKYSQITPDEGGQE